MMTDFPLPSAATSPSALRRRKSDSANPPRASPPDLRKLRREMPSQNGSERPLKKVSLAEFKLMLQRNRNKEIRVGKNSFPFAFSEFFAVHFGWLKFSVMTGVRSMNEVFP